MNEPVSVTSETPAPVDTSHPSRLARFIRLRNAQKRALVAAWLWLPLFWVGLRTLGLPRFQGLLHQATDSKDSSAAMTADEIQSCAAAVTMAASHTPFPATCLTRSLLLEWLLQRRGVRTELRIGVNMTSGILRAHAWVEHEGRPLNDRADIAADFKPFGRLPSVTAFRAS